MCGAAVLVVDPEGRLLLQQRTDNGLWSLPGGSTELGEKLEETAAREVHEEVGLTCCSLELFNVYSGPQLYYRYPNGDEVYNVVAIYICRAFTGEIDVDPAEVKGAAFFAADCLPAEIHPPDRVIIGDFFKSR